MNTEYEIVFTQIEEDRVRQRIKKLGGACTKENTLMKRVVFESPNNSKGSYLRVRDEGGVITCTYKEQSPGDLDIHSIRELETQVGDYDIMINIFRKLGLKEKSYQESYREVWSINNEIEIMIDRWPGLEPYVEIEGQGEEVVQKYSELLGFDYSKGVFGTVFQIYEKELGLGYEYINSLKEITFENPPKK